MVRVAVSQVAFEAVALLPLGRVVYEPELNAEGERLIWVERPALDKLDALRGPGESSSGVILRLVELEVQRRSTACRRRDARGPAAVIS